MLKRNIAAYPIIASAVLAAGIGINSVLDHNLFGNVDPLVSSASLILLYIGMHVIAVALIIFARMVFGWRRASKIYVIFFSIMLIFAIVRGGISRNGVDIRAIYIIGLLVWAVYNLKYAINVQENNS